MNTTGSQTNPPDLIGLVGRKGSGKDTAAVLLIEQGYENVKFAGALKDMIRNLLAYQGVEDETIERMIEGDLKEEPSDYLGGKTPRFVMQTLGTEWGRDLIGKDFWADTAMRRIGNFLDQGKQVVVTDVRFWNECEIIKDAGGTVVGVEADWIAPVPGEHESEALIDQIIQTLSLVVRNTKLANVQEGINQFRARFLRTFQQHATA
jgi:hypothetical protein